MSDWRAVLQGEPFDLLFLRDHFKRGSFRIEQEGDSFVLKSDDFAQLTTDSQVLSRAESLLSLINGAATAFDGSHRAVGIDGIRYPAADGNAITSKFLSARIEGRSRLTADLTSTAHIEGAGTTQVSDMARWVAYADAEPRAQRIFRYLLRRGDWGSLFKVLEEIEEDMGSLKAIRDAGWATLTGMRLFTSTANNRLAIGDAARHSQGKHRPPVKPMTIEKADLLIRGIAQSWLRHKTA